MYIAYLDESGIHADAPFCIVSGYFGHKFAWAKFNRKWKCVLAKHGISEFHAWKFWSRTGEGRRIDDYKKWSNEQAEEFLNELLDAISDTNIHPVGATLVMEHWHPLDTNEREYLTGGVSWSGKFRPRGAPNKPYYLPFQSCILNAARYVPNGKKMKFRFDWNKQLKGHARQVFKFLKTINNLSIHDKLGKISFPMGEEAVGLQAADLLSYQLYKFAPLRVADEHAVPNSIFKKTITGMHSSHDLPFFNRRGVELALEAFRSGTDSKQKAEIVQKPIAED